MENNKRTLGDYVRSGIIYLATVLPIGSGCANINVNNIPLTHQEPTRLYCLMDQQGNKLTKDDYEPKKSSKAPWYILGAAALLGTAYAVGEHNNWFQKDDDKYIPPTSGGDEGEGGPGGN